MNHICSNCFSLQLYLPRHPAAERQRSSPFAVNKFLRQYWKLRIGRKLRKINCLCMLTLLWCFFKSSFHTGLSVQTSTCCLTHSMSFLERVELCSNSLVCQIISWLSDSFPEVTATKWSKPLPWTKLKTSVRTLLATFRMLQVCNWTKHTTDKTRFFYTL